jgi:hypothetical protein
MRSIGRSLAVLALLSNCSQGYQPLNRSALRATNPRIVRVKRWRPPKFDAETMNGAFLMGGLIGAAVGAVVEGSDRKKLTQGGIDEPAVHIREVLGAALARRFSLQIVTTDERVPGLAPGADLLLDVRTTEWGVAPTGRGRYGVKYEGTLRLVDVRTAKTIAEGVCSSRPLDHPDNPSFDDLRANTSERLRDAIREVSEFCAEDYRTRILGLF